MKKNKFLFFGLTLFLVAKLLVSCDEDVTTENNKVEVNIKAINSEKIDYSNFKVKITNQNTNSFIIEDLKNGSAKVLLNKDIYAFTIEGKYKDVDFFGEIDSYSVKSPETLEIDISRVMPKMKSPKAGLIINELFLHGIITKEIDPGEYLTIYNNSDKVLYADGIVIAQCVNRFDKFFLPKELIALSLFQIPGSGKEYPIDPGKQIVISKFGDNFAELYPSKWADSPDMTGADFRAYAIPHNSKHVSNPNVKLLIKFLGEFESLGGGRFGSFVIFDPMEDMSTFVKNNKIELPLKQGKSDIFSKVPIDLVLDGINIGYYYANSYPKSLPDNLDRGSILFDEKIHKVYMVKRKTIFRNGKQYLKDTNNSTEDCIM